MMNFLLVFTVLAVVASSRRGISSSTGLRSSMKRGGLLTSFTSFPVSTSLLKTGGRGRIFRGWSVSVCSWKTYAYSGMGRAGAVGVIKLEFRIFSEIYLSILLPLCFFFYFITAGVSSAFLFLGVSQVTFKFSFSSFRNPFTSWPAAFLVARFVSPFSFRFNVSYICILSRI